MNVLTAEWQFATETYTVPQYCTVLRNSLPVTHDVCSRLPIGINRTVVPAPCPGGVFYSVGGTAA